jgi:hypothetical protein
MNVANHQQINTATLKHKSTKRVIQYLTIIGAGLCLTGSALGTIYTCNTTCAGFAGATYLNRTYEIVFTTQTFASTTPYNLQTTAWWGNSGLARGLATVVGDPGAGDPDFAFRKQADPNVIDYYHFTGGAAALESETVTTNTLFAFGTEVSAPEINGAQLPKAALLLLSLFLMARSKLPRTPLASCHGPIGPDHQPTSPV